MERFTRSRKLTRTSITKLCNKIDNEMNKDEPNIQQILAFREDLQRLAETLQTQDKVILEEMFENNGDDEELEKESEDAENYQNRISASKIKINEYVKHSDGENSSYVASNPTILNQTSSNRNTQRTYKLPKIEIKKFNGEIIEWLSFWSQFEKIHKDIELHNSDKFQYLSQAMEVGTRAMELVKSYPQTADNYPKVIQALIDRFGKKKVLKQVYVRELIKMIAMNIRSNEKVALTKLYDNLESHLRALESLDVTSEQTSEFLFPMVESILPEDILIAWQRSANFGKDGANENPPKTELDFLMQFLKQEVESEQQRGLARAGFSSMYNKQQDNYKKNTTSKVATAASLYVGEVISCIFCGKSHVSHECCKAVDMSLKEKRDILNEKKVCHKCLKNHRSPKCRGWLKCTGCSKPHYHLMCPDSLKNKERQNQVSPSANYNSILSTTGVKQVLLKTLLVKIKTRFGTKTIRVFFDDGSQQSYIKTSIAIALRCHENGKYFERNTLFGGILSNVEERTIYQVQIESLNGDVKRTLELPDKKKLTGDIIKIPKGPWMDELKSKNIEINDYDSSGEDVDILIGADLISFLVLDKSITLKCGLKAVKTIFGWTVMGPIPVQNNFVTSHALSIAADQLDDQRIKGLWDLELIGIRDPATKKSQEEKDLQAHVHFNKTVLRNDDGRYKVTLPWVDGQQSIPNNFEIARKRLINVTKKLKKENMFETYNNIFKQWKEEGIIEKVILQSNDINLIDGHFIPHHAVFKPESKTTPVRPVFDASCKAFRSPSLNECLEKGPNLIELIPKSMFGFRENKIGVISDIRKAFQMIELQEADQNYLMFLWWEDNSCSKLIVFKHKRVVFGIKSSPFILGAVLNYHLNNVPIECMEIAQKLLKSLYVDNSVTSVNSSDEYQVFKREAVRILADAKMDLREWESSLISQNENNGNNNESSSVLGMKWNRIRDTLSCASTPLLPEKLTKRTLLASVNKLFDPLGFLSPAMIFPKLILQATWDRKIDWDEELPDDLKTQFNKWCSQVHCLGNIEIPRCMKGKDHKKDSVMQVHVFNDASRLAYATSVFLRVETSNKVSVQLIQAKARIAPIQSMTIPRLELMGCVLGARMGKSVTESFSIEVPCYNWTDSTTALAWIQRNDDWGTFVGNRVREIVKLTNTSQWFHVPGIKNPADLPSRGCSPKELSQSRWWEGPEWLKLSQSHWPNEDFTIDENLVQSEKKVLTKSVMKNKVEILEDPWFAQKSSYLLCLRILAWIQRFKDNCLAQKKNTPRRSGYLTIQEVNNAEILMVGLVQQQVFPPKTNLINGLRVAKNKDNLYYVITKITHRQDVGRFKNPLLLPNSHPVVQKIIEEEHLRHGHSGVMFIMAKLREKYWIVKTRQTVNQVLKRCKICRRFNAAPATVPMSPLPENRVKDAKTFEVSGIDLAGPLHLKDDSKVWVVIFTCANFRAVHLESVEKIDTEQFILALSRFIYKRGRISVIYTDNGTNFVKTAKLFGQLDWTKIQAKTNTHRIQWIFNPPASPWWGGFWERLVRSLKEYLRKILGQNKLNKVELDTTLSFVESLLNARPLTYISEDPEDLLPLTPAAFIQDIQTSKFPEINMLNEKGFRQKYKELLTMKEELRSRFRSEYLGQLVQRAKPTQDITFEVGDIVFVVDDKKKRLEWPMARIVELFPGKDKEIRVARLKTKNGELVRSLQRLVHMELRAKEIDMTDRPDVVQKSITLHKAKKPEKLKKSIIVDDLKEVITRSGRRVKTPLRLRFN